MIFQRNPQRLTITALQKLFFAPVTAPPLGANGMDYKPRRELIGLRELCMADLASAKFHALQKEPSTGGSMYSAINAATPKKSGVGGVDNGITFNFGYIVSYNINWHSNSSKRGSGVIRLSPL